MLIRLKCQFVAAVVIGVFIYVHLTQVEFVESILGTDLVVAASFLVIISSCLLLVIAFVGIIGAALNKSATFAIVSVLSFRPARSRMQGREREKADAESSRGVFWIGFVS